MKKIKELKNIHPHSDIYIVGTGVSLAFFPTEFLADKITIGLNKAWTHIPKLTYSITIHPELNIHSNNQYCSKDIQWIIKEDKLGQLKKKEIDQIENIYLFETIEGGPINLPNQPKSSSRNVNLVSTNQSRYLYQWSSISATAVHMAYIMGAKNIFLIGCDCSPINGVDHFKPQHTRWRGSSPKKRYFQYKEALVDVRDKLAELDVNVINMLPFIGIDNFEWEFNHLSKKKNIQLEKSLGDIDPITIVDWYKWFKHKFVEIVKKNN